MTLAAGTRLGPYGILSQIGAGGMGEVYKAKDTRLDRIVAVKVLPQSMAASTELQQRFEREARAVSQLSHPNICALFDVGRDAGLEYIVMEYLEGETLSDRLAKGPLAIDQVLQFGSQMADALDRAHKQGIVHRDLKPGNVMLTKAGVKLLDFGLAKNLTAAVETELSRLTSLPTRLGHGAPLTEQGTIMGTFQYMSPEQLEGKEADARADIFALGCVLYEMATGRKAFSGQSRASLIAAILEREPPPISSIAPLTPPALDRVVKTCLAKDPDDRFQTAHDIGLELQWIAEGGSQAGVPAQVSARRRMREKSWMIATVALAILSVVLGVVVVWNLPELTRLVKSSILPPDKGGFDLQSGPMAVSPDGTRIAFIAVDAQGKRQIWIRPLSGLSAQPLQGTDDAGFPFWSPDSRFIAFFAGGKLKKIDASGGPPESICDAPIGRGGSWAADGTIVFAPTNVGAIFRVKASGGTPVVVTKIEESRKEATHRFPCFLPDGRHFLFLARGVQAGTSGQGTGSSICLGSVDTSQSTVLFDADSQGLYTTSGHVLFWREGSIVAVPFDARKLRATGDAFPVAENVQRLGSTGVSLFSVSENGLLAYQSGGTSAQAQLAWIGRDGREIEKVGSPMAASVPRISHDGQRLALDIRDPQSGNSDVWIYEFGRKTLTRFTFSPAFDGFPLWSPDDRWIVFASNRKGTTDIYRKAATGTGAEEAVLESKPNKLPYSWSGDGRWILMVQRDPSKTTGVRAEIWRLALADRQGTSYLASEFDAGEPAFSPDSRYVVYVSSESGRNEIYVQDFPGPGGKWQISTDGGEDPLWSRDGKEIFYVAPGNRLMTVPVKTAPSFEAENSKFLFEARFRAEQGQQYDLSADGQRILVCADLAEQGISPMTLVQNWTAGRTR